MALRPTSHLCPLCPQTCHLMRIRSRSNMAALLAGRLAVVTGGGSGIGKAVCQLFAKEGAKVIVADIDANAAKDTTSTLFGDADHMWIGLDVGDRNSVKSMVENIQKKYDRAPCVAVNCAGITRDSLLFQMDDDKFDEVIRVNLKGTFLMTQCISQAMVSDNITRGSIVNISSIIAKVGNIGQCNYAASKAGVEGVTKTAARELAKFGIRCNAVLPGYIRTPMTSTIPEKVVTKVLSAIPLGRQGEASDVAEACLFLASDRSSYITGISLEVTGGLNM